MTAATLAIESERRLVLTTEAATLRKAAEAVRALSPAAAGRLLAEAAAVEARLDLVPDHLRRPIEAVLGHRVGLRLTDAEALRIYTAMQDDADLPEEAASYLDTYEAVRRVAAKECA